MKITPVRHYETSRRWAVGVVVNAFGGTLVATVGTADWKCEFKGGPGARGSRYAFGLCFGPFMVGGAR